MRTKKVAHTPTPWRIDKSILNGKIDEKSLWLSSGRGADDISVFLLNKIGPGKLEQVRIDAEFIVRAVNNHELLVACLKDACKLLESRGFPGLSDEFRKIIAQARGK